MVAKMFSIHKENLESLEKVDNMSGLINELLSAHFEHNKTNEEELKEKEEKIDALNQEVLLLAHKEEKIKRIQKKREDEKREAYVKSQNSPEKWGRIKEMQREAFDGWKVPEDKKEEMFEEFFELLQSGMMKNIIEYMETFKIERKEVKNIMLENKKEIEETLEE